MKTLSEALSSVRKRVFFFFGAEEKCKLAFFKLWVLLYQ